jgi:redox-sensitive bicupin YhaK (pirin superfamily)
MSGDDLRVMFRQPARSHDASSFVTAGKRRITLVANGRRRGPITRLITPWDVGELTHPFVLLNYAEVEGRFRPLFSVHPPSGITTLTVVLNGQLSFEDATGKRGEVAAAGFAWMKAGSTIWHESCHSVHEPLRMFHLWIAQFGAQTACAAASGCIAPSEVEQDGSVRVLLGEFGRARSRLRHAPADLHLFHVRLKNRQHFRYTTPDQHNVTWLAVDRGSLQPQAGGRVLWGQAVLFDDCAGTIEAEADGETSFVLGSARKRT